MSASLAPAQHAVAPWGRRSTAALIALIVIACASLFWLVHPWYEATRETFDASIYLLCAKSLLAGQGYSVLGMPFTVRPPGFSLLLAPLVAWRGVDFLALNWFVSLFGVAAVACLFALVRPRLGDALAFCLALAVWLNPGFRHLSNQVMSDVPGLAMILGCLLVERWAGRAPSARRDAVLGLAIGVSAYVRTVALLLVPAIVLARALEHGPRSSIARFLRDRALVLAAVPALALLPWSARDALRHPPWPAEQTLLASYSTGMWHADGGDPSSPRLPMRDVLSRARVRAPEVLAHLGGRLDPEASGAVPIAFGAAVIAALILVAIRRRGAPEIFALSALALLLFYFASDWRLSLPIWPIGLCAAAEVLALAAGRHVGPRTARGATATLCLALAWADFSPRRGWSEIDSAHAADLDLSRRINARLSAGERLAAPVGWHWSLLLDRPVYSLYFAARRGGTAGMDEVLSRRAIDAVILRVEPAETPRMIEHLENRYGPGERVGAAVIVRIRR
jgi:hypothetical protein